MERIAVLIAVLALAACEAPSTPQATRPVATPPPVVNAPTPAPSPTRADSQSGGGAETDAAPRVFAFVERDPCEPKSWDDVRYRKLPVELRSGDPAVLTAAIHRLVQHWFRGSPRAGHETIAGIGIALDGETAIVDIGEPRHIGWASASCGGSIFISEMVRTATQFPTVSGVEFRYRGSCNDFGEFMQAGPYCFVFTRENGEITSTRRS